jgi:hypothetical protein
VNLAEVGATSEHVETDQLEHALELAPDVVTLVCGANDVLLNTRPDADAYADRLARMFTRLREVHPEVMILTATYPDISRFLDLRPRSRIRVEWGMRRFNAACREVARRHEVVLLEASTTRLRASARASPRTASISALRATGPPPASSCARSASVCTRARARRDRPRTRYGRAGRVRAGRGARDHAGRHGRG